MSKINTRELSKQIGLILCIVATYFYLYATEPKTNEMFLTKLLESPKYRLYRFFAEPTNNELTNFREFKAHFLDKNIPNNLSVAGFAHPVKYHENVDNTLATLYAKNYTTLISLDELPYKAIQLFESFGGVHYNFPMRDFTAPTYKELYFIYKRIMSELRRGKNVAIHCGEGFGRTGTIIAGGKLLAELENYVLNNDTNLMNHNIEKRFEVELGIHSRTGAAATSKAVQDAILFSRSHIVRRSYMSTYGQAVETEEQVDALNKAEEQRIKRYNYYKDPYGAQEFLKKGARENNYGSVNFGPWM